MIDIPSLLMGKAMGGGGSSVTVEALSVTENGTYTAPTGKAYSPVTVIITGPFILFPKSATTPTPAEVLANGVALYNANTSIYMSNNADVCCFHVGTTLYAASRSSSAVVYSLFGNGNLRTSDVSTFDSTTGLYWTMWANVNVYDTVYNASSRDDGLSRLAMFI